MLNRTANKSLARLGPVHHGQRLAVLVGQLLDVARNLAADDAVIQLTPCHAAKMLIARSTGLAICCREGIASLHACPFNAPVCNAFLGPAGRSMRRVARGHAAGEARSKTAKKDVQPATHASSLNAILQFRRVPTVQN
jgi:hypothetical protein